MTKDEFARFAKSSGYATASVIREYIKRVDKDDYNVDDLIEVYRESDRRSYLAHKPSENNKTTKKYVMYTEGNTEGFW